MYLNHAKAFACILITFYHAFSFSAKFQIENAFRLDVFFGNMFFYGRVPFFLVVAGYLFHHSYARSGNMTNTVVKRVRNLIPPYFFWNIVAMLLIIISRKYGCSNSDNPAFNPNEIVKMISGVGLTPANTPLWFVRDLILLFLVSPLLMRFRGIMPYIGILTIIIGANYDNEHYFKISSIGFYLVGIYLYQFAQPRHLEARISAIHNSSIYIFLGAIFCLALLNQSDLVPTKIGIFGPFLGISMIVIIGELLARATGFISKASLDVSESSFLIYLSHMPIFSILRKIVELIKPFNEFLVNHQIVNYLTWLTFAAIVIAWTIAIHKFIKVKFPKYLIVLTGSR
jgi:hypothetical protein